MYYYVSTWSLMSLRWSCDIWIQYRCMWRQCPHYKWCCTDGSQSQSCVTQLPQSFINLFFDVRRELWNRTSDL